MDNSFTETGTAFAIVSPCSTCKNQLSELGSDGKPYCPRRKWQADLETYKSQNNGNSDPRIEPLAAFGTEGTPQEGDRSLRNPVYSDNGKSTLVWIATLRDNSGVRDGDNNIIAPSILDPSFITNYTEFIQCRSTPYIPSQHEAAYRTSGGLKEGDTVIAMTAQNQQNYSSTNVEGDDSSSYQQVLIEGVVTKINLVYSTPRSPVGVDYNVQGT
jgi:hypothetical protein